MASRYIILWHGTSKSRALSIAKTGFYANSFFTTSIGVAWRYASAKRRAKDPGVLVLCAVDLTAYKKRDYEKSKSGLVYHFIPPVPRNAVAGVFSIHDSSRSELQEAVAGVFRTDQFTRSELKEKANQLRTRIRKHRLKRYEIGRRWPQVMIARNCGAAGIAYWINTYLSVRTDKRIEAAHPGIEQIRMWIEKNYANGRISPISDQEMLMQAKRYVPEFFGNIRAASMRA